ncbi:MAG: hypothetical protein HRT57_12040 [Crocinitomicaceae bacterium]|nr:hypothetical protein [Crocinitomicaceae bacterium]
MKVFSLFLITLCSFSVSSMNVEELLSKVKENYTNATKIEYNTTYELYKGHKSQSVHTSYEGYLYRNGNKVYQKIDKTEMINGADFSLKISHHERNMALNMAQDVSNMEVDLNVILKDCKSKTVEDKGSFYRIKLVYSSTSSTPLSVLYFRIDKKKFTVLQIDMYYGTNQDFSTSRSATDYAQPHLKIKFKDITTNPSDKKELFMFSKYITTTDSLLSPSGNCKGYELIDNRVK